MRWSRRSVLLGALTVAGCGFHPLYASRDQSGFDEDLASIKVHAIADRQGQVLAIALRDGLNPTGAQVEGRYTLDVTLTFIRQDIGINTIGTATRSEIAMTAKFVLRDARTKPVLQSNSHAVSSFDILTDDYATLVAQHEAEDRALQEIGDDILRRLELYVSNHRSAPAPS